MNSAISWSCMYSYDTYISRNLFVQRCCLFMHIMSKSVWTPWKGLVGNSQLHNSKQPMRTQDMWSVETLEKSYKNRWQSNRRREITFVVFVNLVMSNQCWTTNAELQKDTEQWGSIGFASSHCFERCSLCRKSPFE